MTTNDSKMTSPIPKKSKWAWKNFLFESESHTWPTEQLFSYWECWWSSEYWEEKKLSRNAALPWHFDDHFNGCLLTSFCISPENDGIKLVNIGNEDIVKGNLKLILGLIWSLIVRYQIGRSKFPPRKLMLAWLQAALPECKVSNLTTDWNSGVLLSALLNYCDPGET